MKRAMLFVLCFVFSISSTLLAKESKDELKLYLNDMNKIVIDVEEVMRNFSVKILPAKNAVEQISAAVEKFEVLKAPSIFLKDHNKMLSAFKTLRDGLKLLSEAERKRSIELVKNGAALLKEAAIGMRTTAEREGLIPARPKKTVEATKAILPSQTPSVIAGTSPTPSPYVSSPRIGGGSINKEVEPSTHIKVKDIPASASIPIVPAGRLTTGRDLHQPTILTAVGEIVSIESDKARFVIEIKDTSGGILDLDFDPQFSSVLKNAKITGINEINVGVSSYILYTKNNNRNEAIFISILNAEDAAALKKVMGSSSLETPAFKKPIP